MSRLTLPLSYLGNCSLDGSRLHNFGHTHTHIYTLVCNLYLCIEMINCSDTIDVSLAYKT